MLLDTLYQGARCGLYHLAMTAPGIVLERSGQALSSTSNPTRVVIDPHILIPELKGHFASYVARLRDPAEVDLRQRFERCFGHVEPLDHGRVEIEQTYRDRLHIAREDLSQVSRFGGLISLLLDLPTPRDPNQRLNLQALDIALTVAYCRPFTQFRNRHGKREASLPRHLVYGTLSADELKLHDELLVKRDTEYGHSDASRSTPSYHPTSSFGTLVISRNRFVPLSRSQVDAVVGMSNKLFLRLGEEVKKLEAAPFPAHKEPDDGHGSKGTSVPPCQ